MCISLAAVAAAASQGSLKCEKSGQGGDRLGPLFQTEIPWDYHVGLPPVLFGLVGFSKLVGASDSPPSGVTWVVVLARRVIQS